MTPRSVHEVNVLLPSPLLHNRCCVFLYGLNTTYPLRTEKENVTHRICIEELERDHVY